MSDNIPFEIQTEIIKRAPDVRSLVRYRSVCKSWRSFIESSEFIAGYGARKTQPHTLLLRYTTNNQPNYLLINNATLTRQQDLAPNVSALLKQQNDTLVVGYSRSLLCLYAFDNTESLYGGKGMLVLWNPSLRRSVGILDAGYFGVFGFAVCPVTNEPTIVKISFPWKVDIFTLSSKKWTEIQCSKPRKLITLDEGSQVVIGSCIYRVAYETIPLPNGYFTDQYMIVLFDLIAKEFKAVDLPDKITTSFTSPVLIILSKLKGSVVVTVPQREVKPVKVWKMEPDCSFTQLLTINTPDSYIYYIVGLRKNGDVLVETQERPGRFGFSGEARSGLEIYDPCSKQIRNLGFSGVPFFVFSYKETLHLLDHSDSCMYPEIN